MCIYLLCQVFSKSLRLFETSTFNFERCFGSNRLVVGSYEGTLHGNTQETCKCMCKVKKIWMKCILHHFCFKGSYAIADAALYMYTSDGKRRKWEKVWSDRCHSEWLSSTNILCNQYQEPNLNKSKSSTLCVNDSGSPKVDTIFSNHVNTMNYASPEDAQHEKK